MRFVGSLVDWLDSRTGIRTARKHLLDEPTAAGRRLVVRHRQHPADAARVQLITGVVLTMYYVPSPEFAYDSVFYIMNSVAFGRCCAGCTSSAPASSSWPR
jgi:menaquinol-cytochrome c reductase cytochrome b subunit